MGLIGNILSYIRRTRSNGVKFSDVKIDVGGGDIKTAQSYEPAGDDSFPLTGDKAIAIEIPRTGGVAVIGYLDPLDNKLAVAGEKRIYARDLGTGLVISQIHLKADGSIIINNENGAFELKANGSMIGSNNNGSFELESGGDFEVNGVTIDSSGNINTSGNIITSADVTAGTISLKTHTHPAGTPPGPTGPPIP